MVVRKLAEFQSSLTLSFNFIYNARKQNIENTMHECLYIHKCAFQLLLCLLFIARNQFLSRHKAQCFYSVHIWAKIWILANTETSDFSETLFFCKLMHITKYCWTLKTSREWNWNKLIKIYVKRISWNFVYSHSSGAQKASRQNADRKFRVFIDRELNFISPSTHKHLSHILFLDFYLETFRKEMKARKKGTSTGVSVFPLLYI